MNERVKFSARYLQKDEPFSALSERAGVSRKTGYKWVEAPNAIWCADFKGHFPVGEARCHPLTIIDGFSRYLLRCQALPRPRSAVRRSLREGGSRTLRQKAKPRRDEIGIERERRGYLSLPHHQKTDLIHEADAALPGVLEVREPRTCADLRLPIR